MGDARERGDVAHRGWARGAVHHQYCWPSSRERSRAASRRRDDPGADAVRVEHLDRGDRGAARRRHPFAQHRGMVARLRGERRGPLDGGHGELRREVPAQPEQHARLGHRVDQVERVRRPGPGDRGHGVEVLLLHPDHEAGGGEHLLDEHQVPLARVRAGGDGAGALADDGRRVRHDADDGLTGGQPLLVARDRQPGGDADDELAAAQGLRDLVEHRGDDVRLDREQHDVGAGGRVGVRRPGAHAVPAGELVGPRHVPLGDLDLLRRPSRGQQRAEQGLAHHAAAQHRDLRPAAGGLVGHRASSRPCRRRATRRAYRRERRHGVSAHIDAPSPLGSPPVASGARRSRPRSGGLGPPECGRRGSSPPGAAGRRGPGRGPTAGRRRRPRRRRPRAGRRAR